VWLVVLCGLTACSTGGEASTELVAVADCTPRRYANLTLCDLSGVNLFGADVTGVNL
jgi:uncharacterized protein YjbI with pentapeptide repeats